MSFNIGIPNTEFHMRVETDTAPGFEWKTVPSQNIFSNKRVILFGLPGAFTPTCSSTHLPGFDTMYDEFLEQGIDEIYCVSVNDSFTMNAWFKSIGIDNVKALPDGSGDFTRALGMLVKKDNLGFGMRSWRYSAIVQDGLMTDMFVEAGMQDNASEDPFLVSDAYTMMDRCKAIKADK